MNILVTGSTGFVGSNLCRGLIDQGHRVRAFHRSSSNLRLLEGLPVEHVLGDLTQPETLEAAMEGAEVVFHAAAWLGDSHQTGRQYAVTVEGTRVALQAARKAGVRRVVHTSTAATLGMPDQSFPGQTELLNENHAWNIRPDDYPYGYAKYLAEQEVQKAVAQGLDVVIVNPCLVFGAGDLYRQASSLITQVADRHLTVVTEGGVNCVHIEDVVRGHLAALDCGRTGERYILGSENLSFRQLLQMIAGAAGVPAPHRMVPASLLRAMAGPAQLLHSYLSLPVSPEMLRMAGYNFFYDLHKAEKELGLTQRRPVQEAIQEAYAWYTQAN